MVHVSKNKLKPNVSRDIARQFISTISSLDRKAAEIFFNDFFTPSERLMFAKRLATLYLLRNGASMYRISQVLKVSTSTIGSLNERFSRLEKESIVAACEQFDTSGGLLRELQNLVMHGFSMNPKRRAQWLNEFERKYQT